MKKAILIMLLALAAACSNGGSTSGSNGTTKNSITPETLSPGIESYIASDASAAPKANAFLLQVAGKNLVFNGEASRTIDSGQIKNEEVRTVEDCFRQKEITTTDSTGKVVRTDPTDNIISLKFVDSKYAVEVTQTSPGKSVRTQYSLDEAGSLQLNLIEASGTTISYKLGGTVVVQGDKLILRRENKMYQSNLIDEQDSIFNIQQD